MGGKGSNRVPVVRENLLTYSKTQKQKPLEVLFTCFHATVLWNSAGFGLGYSLSKKGFLSLHKGFSCKLCYDFRIKAWHES